MKVVKVDLPETLKEIEIMAIADWHWSDPHSDHDKIMADLDYVRSHDNVYMILNGDLLNCAIKSSVSDCYSETMSPMEELKACTELFKGLEDRIICVVPGNHEARHFKTNGIDLTEIMCRELKIQNRYSPTTAFVFLRFGKLDSNSHNRKVAYTIYVTHGNSGGRKEGSKIQRLVDYSTICDADIYLCGHTHLPAMLKDGFARPNMANSSVTYGTRLYLNTSAKLGYGGYADTWGLKPPCTDTPIIHLNGTKKEMRATL